MGRANTLHMKLGFHWKGTDMKKKHLPSPDLSSSRERGEVGQDNGSTVPYRIMVLGFRKGFLIWRKAQNGVEEERKKSMSPSVKPTKRLSCTI